MPEVKRTWRINGTVKPLAPAVLAEQAMEYDLPADWHGLANGITVPRGRNWGTAHFLIQDSDLEGLQGRANNIQCYHEGGTTTWKNWYVESSQAITKQGTPAHWVRFADPRWLLENSCSEGKRYNLRSSESGFIADTTVGGGGTPYTWAQVIADLWTFLPAGAGAAPSLAATPSSTPENLYFDGLGAWCAINQTLTAIGQCIVYNPFTGTFSIVDLTVPQTITYPLGRLFDGVAGGSEYGLPNKAGVLYHLLPGDNDYLPFKDKPWYLEASIGGEQGTHEIVDTTFYYDGRDLTGRTTEIANALGGLLDPKVNPKERIYSGIWAQVPGSRISAMRWVSDGTRGMQTMLFYDFEPFDWPGLPDFEATKARRNWIGFLYHSYRGIVSGFWVVPTIALDGALPDGPQWVVNIYRWNFGIIAATVRVEEDPLNERWLALQQEYVCPDNREIAEPPPPETPPPYPYPE